MVSDIRLRAAAELELRRRRGRTKPLPHNLAPLPGEHPAAFLQRQLPSAKIPTGDRHMAVWDWFAAMERGKSPRARVEVWGRGGAKSDIAEKGCAYLACTLNRRFALYVCGTQDQADDHVQNIASILERMGIPRAVSVYGDSVNWTAKQLQTINGFGVLGVGLNARVRGARFDEFRPDLIILDDVDGQHDSAAAVQKKIGTISKAILPAGSSDVAVLFIQNLIHKDSAIAQTADGRAGILLGADVTIEPAVIDLEYERTDNPERPYVVTGGQPTWEQGQGLAVVEDQINIWGLPAFLTESQHEPAPDGGLWSMERDIDPYRVSAAPEHLQRIVIGVDPSGSLGTEAGVVAVGKSHDGHYYVLADDSLAGTTDQWVRAAIARYHALKADTLVVERNYGGDIVRAAIRNADPRVGVIEVTATRGKLVRAEPVHQLYQQGVVHHVGRFIDLEKELCTWGPGMDSPNRLDAAVWSFFALMEAPSAIRASTSSIW